MRANYETMSDVAKASAARGLKLHLMKKYGFMDKYELEILAKTDRLCPVLVRCGCGRFTAPAQDVNHFIKCVEAGGDYVRDVSLPAGTSVDSHGGA